MYNYGEKNIENDNDFNYYMDDHKENEKINILENSGPKIINKNPADLEENIEEDIIIEKDDKSKIYKSGKK